MGIPSLLLCVTDVDSRSSGQASPLHGTTGICFQTASPSPGLQQEEGGGGRRNSQIWKRFHNTFYKLPKPKKKNRLTFRGEQKIELMFHGKFLSQFKIKLHFPTAVYCFFRSIGSEA